MALGPLKKMSGCFKGNKIVRVNSSLTSRRPPIFCSVRSFGYVTMPWMLSSNDLEFPLTPLCSAIVS